MGTAGINTTRDCYSFGMHPKALTAVVLGLLLGIGGYAYYFHASGKMVGQAPETTVDASQQKEGQLEHQDTVDASEKNEVLGRVLREISSEEVEGGVLTTYEISISAERAIVERKIGGKLNADGRVVASRMVRTGENVTRLEPAGVYVFKIEFDASHGTFHIIKGERLSWVD